MTKSTPQQHAALTVKSRVTKSTPQQHAALTCEEQGDKAHASTTYNTYCLEQHDKVRASTTCSTHREEQRDDLPLRAAEPDGGAQAIKEVALFAGVYFVDGDVSHMQRQVTQPRQVAPHGADQQHVAPADTEKTMNKKQTQREG